MNIYPNAYFNRVEEITIEFLNKNKIKALLLDVDNTLVDYSKKMTESVIKWAKERSKWYWLVDKFNKFCTENVQFKNYKIDVDKIDTLAKEIQRENKLKLSKQGGWR